MLGEVGFVVPLGEVSSRRPGFRPDDHHDIGLARRDRAAELGDQLLGALPADGFQHRAGRVGANPLHHRPRVVVRLAQLRRHGPGDLELPQADDHVDGLGDGVLVGAGVGQRRARRRCRQFDCRHPPVARVVDVLGELPDADDHGSARVDGRALARGP